MAGLNLYNNGFSGGLIAIVLYPVITAIARHRRPLIQDEEYYDQFFEDTPINPPLQYTDPGQVPVSPEGEDGSDPPDLPA